MNVLILEDEELTAQRLTSLLAMYDATIHVLAQLPSVAKAIHWFTTPQPLQPDLIFLDIELEDASGFALIDRLNLTIPIIFTTAYDQYTLQAFKANSIDYLLKPIDSGELSAALNKFKLIHPSPGQSVLNDAAFQHLMQRFSPPTYRSRFMVSVGPKLFSVRTDVIAYFFSEDKATYLMPQVGGALWIDYSMDRLSELLDPGQFFRINRAYIVAAIAIKSVHTYSGSKLKLDLQPQPRQDVFVSIDRVPDFKEWLGK